MGTAQVPRQVMMNLGASQTAPLSWNHRSSDSQLCVARREAMVVLSVSTKRVRIWGKGISDTSETTILRKDFHKRLGRQKH